MSSRGPKGRHAGNSACLGQPPPVQIRMGAFCSCLYPFLIAIFIQIHPFKALFVFCKSGIADMNLYWVLIFLVFGVVFISARRKQRIWIPLYLGGILLSHILHWSS